MVLCVYRHKLVSFSSLLINCHNDSFSCVCILFNKNLIAFFQRFVKKRVWMADSAWPQTVANVDRVSLAWHVRKVQTEVFPNDGCRLLNHLVLYHVSISPLLNCRPWWVWAGHHRVPQQFSVSQHSRLVQMWLSGRLLQQPAEQSARNPVFGSVGQTPITY